MRPYKVFIFFALAAGALALAAYIAPSTVRFNLRESVGQFLKPETDKTITDHYGSVIVQEPDSVLSVPPGSDISLTDSVLSDTPDSTSSEINDSTSFEINYSTLSETDDSTLVTLTDTSDRVIKPTLAFNFARRLGNDTSTLRIMFFGDSQLEGDRLSSYLRSDLQKRYGGTGPGLLQPLMPVMYTRSAEIRSSSNWKRFNYLSFRDGTISHRRLGPFMAVNRFLPPDSVTTGVTEATVRITPSVFASPNAARYHKFRLFYGNLTGQCLISLSSAGELIATDTLRQGEGPFEHTVLLNGINDVRIKFTGQASPDIYAFSIEGDSGIIVDNIPHRGSAGLEFTMADKSNLKALLLKLEPDLIVLHYGLNVVRNVRSDYTYYQKGLERQIALLKEACPSAELILLGITDMAQNSDGTMTSFPNIADIRDAQEKAAMAMGIGFWDSYGAMGGENSIVKWVSHMPPLGQSDYTHLTYEGSDSLAKLFLGDLIYREYEDTLSQYTPLIADTLLNLSISLSDSLWVPTAETGTGSAIFMKMMIYDPDKPFIFTNISFWLFLIILLAGYSLIYKKPFIRNFYLLIFSLFFYYKSGGFFLILLIISTITDYTAGRLIYKSRSISSKRLWLILSLMVNLGMLGYFKYYGFLIDSVNQLTGSTIPSGDILASIANNMLGTSFSIGSVILPVGISFFTFQTISYTVDVYRGKLEPVRSILDFGFYVSFFPQLVAGPIVRASEFIPQLYARFSLSKREFSHALFLITKGLVKKMIISDYLSLNFVDRVFGAPELYTGTENLLAVYGYGLQIYCDFSGYTDIAIGVALLLGFRLPVNFNSPYKATGVSDFWRRWHISLSRWLKDYLYIPLGGSRHGTTRTALSLMVTMVLGGLWHGASGRFVVWGFLHGIGLIINKIWSSLWRVPPRKNRLITLLHIFLTFNFISFAWIFFRADSNELSLLMVKNIFSGFDPSHLTAVWKSYPYIVVLILTGYILHFLPERVKEAVRGLFVRTPLPLLLLVMISLAVLLVRMQSSGLQPFIYFRF